MNKKAAALLSSAAGLLFLHGATLASETTKYSYDPLGRLVGVSTLGGPRNGTAVTTDYDPAGNRDTYSIANAPTVPGFSINDVSSIEGGLLTFTVTKSGTATGSLSVSYATANGTAAAGSDYTAASGTLTFAQADTTRTITVATTNDTASESSETVLVNLSGATGGSAITVPRGTGTILDNDTPPSFAINDVSANEGGSLTFTVTRTGAATGSFSVNYATANGTATSPSDYTSASGTLTFAQADTARTINVATINDTATESTETVLVNLSGASGGSTIADAQGSGTIIDNDAGNSPPVAVGDTGSMTWCVGQSFNVLVNDSDPDGNLPLALVSASGGGARGTPSIVSNQVWFEPSGVTGTASVSYTMRDSLNATASATLTITIGDGSCGPPQAPPAVPQSSDGNAGG